MIWPVVLASVLILIVLTALTDSPGNKITWHFYQTDTTDPIFYNKKIEKLLTVHYYCIQCRGEIPILLLSYFLQLIKGAAPLIRRIPLWQPDSHLMWNMNRASPEFHDLPQLLLKHHHDTIIIRHQGIPGLIESYLSQYQIEILASASCCCCPCCLKRLWNMEIGDWKNDKSKIHL